MTRDEQIAEAGRLRNEGKSYCAIAKQLGVPSHATIWKWLNPSRAADCSRIDNARRGPQKRAWENAMRATCGHCGGPMRAGSLKVDGSTRVVRGARCRSCMTQDRVDNALEMIHLRNDLGLWNTQIAERLGLSMKMVATELTRLRALGYDVRCSPYNGFDKRPVEATALGRSAESLGRALRARGIYPTRRAA